MAGPANALSAQPAPDPGVTVRWLASDQRTEAAQIWRRLEARSTERGLTCSWEWTRAWLEHYGDEVPHRFAVGIWEDEPCGVVLVTAGVGRRRGPFRLRTVHLGTAGARPDEEVYVEYNRVLVDPIHRARFATALIDELRRESAWHELRLDGFDPEEAEPFLVAEPLLEPERMVCPVMDLRGVAASGASVVDALGSSARRKVRRSLEALGEVETEWAATEDHALDILEELVQLHQRRWTAAGEPGAFASERFVRFHRALVPRLLPLGEAILFRVRASDGTVGCLYHFQEHGRVLFYQSGLTSYENRRISQGFLTFSLCLQECLDRGMVEYDFLAGDARYKRELASTQQELVFARARREALRWRLLDGAARVREGLRRG